MVERRVSDGKRIGQLLASELSGLSVGVLDEVSVSDADPDATPSEEGTEAYRVTHDGTVVGSVLLYPEHVEVVFRGECALPGEFIAGEPADDGRADTLRVTEGAAVKRAVDALRDGLQSQ